jgi:hypothetical protein
MAPIPSRATDLSMETSLTPTRYPGAMARHGVGSEQTVSRLVPMLLTARHNRLIGGLALGDLLLSFRLVGLVGFWCFLPFGRAGAVVQFRQDGEMI